MRMMIPVTYIVVAALTTLADFLFARLSFRKKEKFGRYLGLSALMAGVVTASYLFSLLTTHALAMSVASTVYFCCIDWMLAALTRFIYLYTESHLQKSARVIRGGIIVYALFDTGVMIANIFTGVAVTFTRVGSDGPLDLYVYEMKPLYIAHLVFSYLMVALMVGILIAKILRTPPQYRNQYYLLITAIAVVVIINAIFLFQQEGSLLSMIDYSVFGYTAGLLIAYWSAFYYRRNDMMKSLAMEVFQHIGQGLVLFDYADRLVMYNKKVMEMMPGVDFKHTLQVNSFLKKAQISEKIYAEDQAVLQCEQRGSLGEPLRCDFNRLRNERGEIIGNLFIFTDEAEEVDLLTGFQRVDVFRKFAAEHPGAFPNPTSALVMDINNLGEINRVFGRETGDQRIRSMARMMQQHLPEGTIFIRGFEAHLVAVCRGMDEKTLRQKAEELQQQMSGTTVYGLACTGQPGGAATEIWKTIETAGRSLRTKKLLSAKSFRSGTLTSLVRALQEADSDTEAHVRRTQKIGAALGERIGLSDSQQADLQLLCLLHDIGKIGVPLEILNKPGPLTEQEWAVMRTHPQKGYQIAMSNRELRDIAPMILCHHERWDGNGYPEGLKEGDIPILSRVISLVDSYDAMVNNRAYRPAISIQEAQEEIRRCAGTQFDPEMVEAFLQLLRENPAIGEGEDTEEKEIPAVRAAQEMPAAAGATEPIACARYRLDVDEVIIQVDEAFAEITGYSAEEAVGKMTQFDLIPPGDRNDYIVQVNNCFARGNYAYLRHPILRKDGSLIQVICYGSRHYDSAERAFRAEILIFREADISG